jgi:hypothetical protein
VLRHALEDIKRIKENMCFLKRVPDRKISECHPISADFHKHPEELLGMGWTNHSS